MFTITDLSGGLWIPDQTDFALPQNALLQADNLDYLPSGGIRGRRGRTKYNATLLPGSVLSLWRHYPRAGTPATLVAFVNGATVELRHDTLGDGTFSAATGGTGFAANTRWHFSNWPSKNRTFLANGVDNLRSYNGVFSDMGATPKKGPYLTVWQTRLWATEPTELNYSVYCTDVDNETSWPPDNHLNVSDPQGGLITGLAGFDDRLIILKTTGLWSFFGDIDLPVNSNLVEYSDEGCVAPETVRITPYGVIYLGRKGLMLTDGTKTGTQELSGPLRPLFVTPVTQNMYPNAVAIWYSRREQIWLTLTAGATTTRIGTRNPNTKAVPKYPWATHTVTGMNAACVWDSEAEDGRLLVGGTSGQVWTMDTATTDDGVPIVTTAKLIARLIDPPLQRFGHVTKVKTLHRATSPLSGTLEYDFSGVADVSFAIGATGLAVKDIRSPLWDLSKWGRFVALSLANPADSSAYELHRIDVNSRLHDARRWP
jgi:hypothetical protein